MAIAETLLAFAGLAACLLLLAGMALGARRRQRMQAWFRRALRWRRDRRDARREAEAAIERVRRKVDRDGNVYRPQAFGGDRNGNAERPPDDGRH